MDMASILLMLLSGGVIGFVLGLVGGGGSILAVPLLVYAVGAYAVQQQRWNRSSRGGLLGEESEPPMRWGDFVCEHHQLLSCVVKGRGRSRQENFLAVATSTLAMLYWKAFFRSKLRMASIQALKDSIWTLLVSKAVQQVIKQHETAAPNPNP